jgi:hypothetical protein
MRSPENLIRYPQPLIQKGVLPIDHTAILVTFSAKIPFDSGHEAAEPKRVILGDKSK